MDCNKEEAIRAKDIAENKMQNKDFDGAKKVLLKAQQLLPGLDNLPQMLTVCEVHCSAGIKVNGQTDWYGILQVQPVLDISSIKKQYRKLALLLHPDKNQFPGAEAAFKLIGEAHMTLTDTNTRSLYDIKRKTNRPTVSFWQASQPQTQTYYNRNPNPVPNNAWNNTAQPANGINQQQQQQQQQQPSDTYTFWTACPSCRMRYQYYGVVLNRNIRCQQCKKSFIAYDLTAQAAATVGNSGFQGNIGRGFTASKPSSSSGINIDHGGQTNNVKDGKFEEVKLKEVKKRERPTKRPAGNTNQKSSRKIIESSDSDSVSDSDSTDDEDIVIEKDDTPKEQNAYTAGNCYPRRSTRQKNNVTYNEDGEVDDDDFANHTNFKRLRKGGSSFKDTTFSEGDADVPREDGLPNGEKLPNEFKMDEKGAGEEKIKTKPSSDTGSSSPKIGSFSYPDPEFCDFEKEKDASQFKVDQIWAVYDDSDGMPRFYARIRKIIQTPYFILRYAWLENNPIGEAQVAWSESDLPVACGNYTLGKSKSTEECLMFSHLMSWKSGKRRNSYDIYPKKGEVWAIFKGWDISWASSADRDKLHEYEIVEILSNYSDAIEITVVRMVRVKGFVCLFTRPKDDQKAAAAVLSIPRGEVLRFSHKVPSYRLNGSEREGIPEGSFELDPASLPPKFEEAFPAIDLDACCFSTVNKSGCVHPRVINLESESMSPEDEVETSHHDSSSYPDTEFHDFNKEKSTLDLQCGQIWALYSDVDEFPKFYGYIRKVKPVEFKVHVAWLESCPARKEADAIKWLDKDLPVGSGVFKVSHDVAIFDSIDAFSHRVHTQPSKRKDQYEIWPNTGEVWALYRDWSVEWTRLELERCEFELVEVLGKTSLGFEVKALKKVNGYGAVFMPEPGGDTARKEVAMGEYLRFSHQIPAFRLTNEMGGELRGYWELDTASLPEIPLLVNSD